MIVSNQSECAPSLSLLWNRNKTRSSSEQAISANQPNRSIEQPPDVLFSIIPGMLMPQRLWRRKRYAHSFALRKTHFTSSSWFVMVSLFGKQKRDIYCTNDPTNTVDRVCRRERVPFYTFSRWFNRLWDKIKFSLIGQSIPGQLINLWDILK